MRTIFLKLTIFFMVILFFASCASKPKVNHITNVTAPGEEFKTESSYYYFTEAQLYEKKGNLDRSVLLLKQAIALDSDSVYLQKELADLYLLQKDNQNALRVVEEILKKHPEDIGALIAYGKIKQSLQQLDEAKAAYQQVITKAPDQKNIYLLLGSIYMQENDLSAALQLYQKLIEKSPDSYVAHFYVGKIYAKQGYKKLILQDILTIYLRSN